MRLLEEVEHFCRMRPLGKPRRCWRKAQLRATNPPAHWRSIPDISKRKSTYAHETSEPRREMSWEQQAPLSFLWLLGQGASGSKSFLRAYKGNLGIRCLITLYSSALTPMRFPRHLSPAQCHLSETDKTCHWQKKRGNETLKAKGMTQDPGAKPGQLMHNSPSTCMLIPPKISNQPVF